MGDRRFGRGSHDHETSEEYPPFSRLFVLCDKSHSENDFRDRFSKFGTIEDMRFVKDRTTGEYKGVVYIKYAKTSEAANAVENMNGKTMGNVSRPIKVKVASSRQEGPVREDNEEKYVRLFVIIPRTMTDSELRDEFGGFGKVDYATVVKDKETRESKGYGYVKFKNFSEAANAFENADKKYKAIFAEPKRYKNESNSFDPYFPSQAQPPIAAMMPHPGAMADGFITLSVICNPICHQEQIRKLFDIIPGLDYFQYKVEPRRHMAMAQVVYTNHQSAKYARDKLHGFEYPPGSKLVVKPCYNSGVPSFGDQSPEFMSMRKPVYLPGENGADLAQLAETIAQATSLIQAAAAGTLGQKVQPDDSFCNVKLPSSKPLASIDAPVAQRCFIVCQPRPPPISVLRDAFSRFGNLIDVYTLPNKSVGYAKYAIAESAQEARKILHGAELCGIRMKVLEAEEPRYNSNTAHSGENNERSDSSQNNDVEHDDRRKRLKIES